MSPQPNFRRVHRLTPLLRLWSVILALIAGFALNANMEALRDIFAFITGEHRGEALRDTALARKSLPCAAAFYLSNCAPRAMTAPRPLTSWNPSSPASFVLRPCGWKPQAANHLSSKSPTSKV